MALPTLSGYPFTTFVKNEVTVTTGTTVTLAAPYDWLFILNGSTVAALTIALPASPVDGQICVFSCPVAITSTSFSPAVTGFTNTTALSAGQGIWLGYSVPQGAWYVLSA